MYFARNDRQRQVQNVVVLDDRKLGLGGLDGLLVGSLCVLRGTGALGILTLLGVATLLEVLARVAKTNVLGVLIRSGVGAVLLSVVVRSVVGALHFVPLSHNRIRNFSFRHLLEIYSHENACTCPASSRIVRCPHREPAKPKLMQIPAFPLVNSHNAPTFKPTSYYFTAFENNETTQIRECHMANPC